MIYNQLIVNGKTFAHGISDFAVHHDLVYYLTKQNQLYLTVREGCYELIEMNITPKHIVSSNSLFGVITTSLEFYITRDPKSHNFKFIDTNVKKIVLTNQDGAYITKDHVLYTINDKFEKQYELDHIIDVACGGIPGYDVVDR